MAIESLPRSASIFALSREGVPEQLCRLLGNQMLCYFGRQELRLGGEEVKAIANLQQPGIDDEALEKICYSSRAAVGTGLVETWEWNQLEAVLTEPSVETLTLAELTAFLERARGLIEWGTGTVNGEYRGFVLTPVKKGIHEYLENDLAMI